MDDNSQRVPEALRLALFAFGSPSMSLDVGKINRLRRIVSFVASEHAPMFMRVHVKPRAVNDPGNIIFLRELAAPVLLAV